VGLRLFRRIKIAPGITLNVSKSGLSTSLGPRGAKVTIGRGRVRKTVGLPGTGLFYTTASKLESGDPGAPTAPGAGAGGRRRRGRWLVGGALALIGVSWLASLGGSGVAPMPSLPATSPQALVAASAQPSAPAASTATQKPSATPKPTPKPTARPTPKPTARPTPRATTLTVRITSVTSPANRNSYASLTAKTAAAARCSIEVDYASGPSSAAGLGDKTASSTGAVGWTWKIGGNTTAGTWPIYVTCSRSGQDATASSHFRVI
jgi:hypothetical protein